MNCFRGFSVKSRYVFFWGSNFSTDAYLVFSCYITNLESVINVGLLLFIFGFFFLFSSKSASMNYNFSGHAYSICLKKYFFAWNASYYLQMDLMITCKFSEVLKSRSTMNSARTFITWFLRKIELPKYFLLIKNSISSIY